MDSVARSFDQAGKRQKTTSDTWAPASLLRPHGDVIIDLTNNDFMSPNRKEDLSKNVSKTTKLKVQHLQSVVQTKQQTCERTDDNAKAEDSPSNSASRLIGLLRQVKSDPIRALKVAKTCDLLPRADSLVFFSKVDGFFRALLKDEDSISLLQGVVDALEETKEECFRSFLKQAFTVESGISSMTTLKNVPKGLFEYALEYRLRLPETLASGDEDGLALLKMADLLGVETCCEVVQRLLAASQQFLVREPMSHFIRNALCPTPDKAREVVLICKRWISEALQEKVDNERNDSAEKLGACAIRLAQICHQVLHRVGDLEKLELEYAAFCEGVIQGRTSVEFRQIVNMLNLLLATDADWALRVQRKLVNNSQLKQMKCRAAYSNAVRSRLSQVENEEEDAEVRTEVREATEFFGKNGEISLRLKQLRVTRPNFFNAKLWPFVLQKVAKSGEATEGFVQAIKREWPALAAWQQPEIAAIDSSAEEIAKRVVSLIGDVNHVQTLAESEFVPWMDQVRRNIKTFCALSDGPFYPLTAVGASLFKNPKLANERFLHLQRLFIENEPHLGRNVIELVADEVLLNGLLNRNETLLKQLERLNTKDGMVSEWFFRRIAYKGCQLGNLELCLKGLSVYASVSRLAPNLCFCETASALMGWLRDRTEACAPVNSDEAYRDALDQYDASVVNHSFFRNEQEFFAAELECQFAFTGSIQRVSFICQVLRERFDFCSSFRAGVEAMFRHIIRKDFQQDNFSDIVLSLSTLMREIGNEGIVLKCKEMYGEIWRTLVAEISWDCTRLQRMILHAMEIALLMFPHKYTAGSWISQPIFTVTHGAFMDELGLKYVLGDRPGQVAVPTLIRERIFQLVDQVFAFV